MSDRNQDALTYTPSGLTGATLTPTTYGKALFQWTPTALGTTPIVITVQDRGNGVAANALSVQQSLNLVVRATNQAPVLPSIAPVSAIEGQPLTLQLAATDGDGDQLTYDVTNLPAGAVFDPQLGKLTWTPTFFQAGTYNPQVRVSDGNQSVTQTIAIQVQNVNQAPTLIPLPIQSGQENVLVQFTLVATDIDQDAVVYSALNALPVGMSLDPRSGIVSWKPTYEQAGTYVIPFGVIDANGATNTRNVTVQVANVNRTPTVAVSSRAIALGEVLAFNVTGRDPDLNTTLVYSVDRLPEGATLNAQTGAFRWVPTAGQVGDYAMNFTVSDGAIAATKTVLFQVKTAVQPPAVTVELTPSFATVPGQKVQVQASADSLATIANLTVTVNGQSVVLDNQGRGSVVPSAPGRLAVEAIATDVDGRIGQTQTVIKVRNPLDVDAPVVSFAGGLNGTQITRAMAILGTVSDLNLDEWVLEIAPRNGATFTPVAQGTGVISGAALSQLDPATFNNGFYQLRLRAIDMSGRSSSAMAIVEINSAIKAQQYQTSQTDLRVTLGGVLLNLVRTYDSLTVHESGTFGAGWHLANVESRIQTDVALTGSEATGVYNPFEVGTRLYLTTPTGERVGFTFAPQSVTILGLTYYRPAWVADAGVNYTLTSADALLSKGGDRFYELETARPYNPASGLFGGAEYTLTASNGTAYRLSTVDGVKQQISNGVTLTFSDSGVTSSMGEAVRFVKDAIGRLTQVVGTDGTVVQYGYDGAQLVSVRNLALGLASRYGYDADGKLAIEVGKPGEAGIALVNQVPLPVAADLGSAVQFTEQQTNVTGQRYSFSLRQSELESTATKVVLLGVSGQTLPMLKGYTPVEVHGGFGLYAIDRAGLHLLEMSGVAGRLKLEIAGDINLDGAVDGTDSQLLQAGLRGEYAIQNDLNHDGVVDAIDVQILGSNYGFVANRAPVVTAVPVRTHTDLEVAIPLNGAAIDPEGDAIAYRFTNVVGGTVMFAPDGQSLRVMPTISSGTMAFDLIADDGFSSSAPTTMTVNVSNAALVNLDFVKRNPKLEVGQSTELVVIGDFADQEDVVLAGSYLTYGSDLSTVSTIGVNGQVDGLSGGVSILSAARNGIQATTVLRVGEKSLPVDQQQLNVSIAEQYGLHLYPTAATLIEGMTRQLLVNLNGASEDAVYSSPDLRSTSTGTRYFVSNPNVLQVDSNGLITALDVGISNVTVVYGASEFVVPIQVQEIPEIGTRQLNEKGGIVRASDDALVMIAPSALSSNTLVSLTPLSQSNIMTVPREIGFLGAYALDVGEEDLNASAQFSIPNTTGLPIGTQVFFFQQGSLPDAAGTWQPTWLIEDTGIVTENGTIQTQSFPFNTIVKSTGATLLVGTMTVAQAASVNTGNIWAAGSAGGSLVPAASSIAVASAYSGIAMGAGLIGLIGLSFAQVLATQALTTFVRLYDPSNVKIIGIPRIGLPSITPLGVELNPQGLPTVTATINPIPSSTSGIDSLSDPEIESASLEFINNEPLVTIIGNNFLNDSGDLGSRLEDLIVNFRMGDRIYPGTLLLDQSTGLGYNHYKVRVKVPDTVVLGESRIEIVRRQKERQRRRVWDTEIVSYTSSAISLEPDCTEYVLTARRSANAVDVINLNSHVTGSTTFNSSDLLLASIPLGEPEQRDLPKNIAAKKGGTSAYVTLEGSGKIALLDLMRLQQIDTDSEQIGINPITIPSPGSAPASIVIDPKNQYAYIADSRLNKIYVLDVAGSSKTYNQIIHTISVNPAPHGLRDLAISNDGQTLFATAPNASTSGKGQILAINIASSRLETLDGQPLVTWRQIGAVEAGLGLESISTTADSNRLVFTNRKEDASGFGILTISSNAPEQFNATTQYVPLRIGPVQDYFDVNEGISATVTRDGKYAFVAGRNGRLFGSGFENIDGVRAGSNVGIIKDPFTDEAKLVAATRPIPMGLASDLVLSSDDRYLTVTYPGVGLDPRGVSNSTKQGGIFTFDVEQMIATVENPSQFQTDFLGRGNGYPGFPGTGGLAPRPATLVDLTVFPIDDINPLIDQVAADYRIIEADWKKEQFIYRVPIGSSHPPLARGSNPASLTRATAKDWLDIVNPTTDDPTPTLSWEFKKHDDSDPCSPQEDMEPLVKKVELFVSVFPDGQGLMPDNRWQELENPQPNVDYNLNRILTATWENGVWSFRGQQTPGTKNQFTLPDSLQLTGGQTYYWAVRATTIQGDIDEERKGQFKTVLPSPQTRAFSSVTMLTRGMEPLSENEAKKMDEQLEAIARRISSRGEASILQFNWTNYQWEAIKGTLKAGQPLILLPNWTSLAATEGRGMYNYGSSEEAADALFASLVSLNQQLGGQTFPTNNLFKSPFHFVGFGQGAVVNSEIIQRLGTFFPKSSGSFEDFFPDLQMTTVDPYDYDRQSPQDGNLQYVRDPEIRVWDNVTFADNYYQTQADQIKGDKLNSADINVVLDGKDNLTSSTSYDPHQLALDWYIGTANLGKNKAAPSDERLIYRRLGDYETNSSIKPWYLPNQTAAPDYTIGNAAINAPWEGIGTGWFFSVLGGGNGLRPSLSTSVRTSVTEDNTYTDYGTDNYDTRLRGDYAVSTLFNGNFDITAFQQAQPALPVFGWSYQEQNANNRNDARQSNLVNWGGIRGLGNHLSKIEPNYAQQAPNYALKMGAGGVSSVIHNPFVVPQWGTLRFNIYVPSSPSLSGRLLVSIRALDDNGSSYKVLKTVSLAEAIGTPANYQGDRDRLGYGFEGGFETFTVDSINELKELEKYRGKRVVLKFEVQGSSSEFYLDDVFFKSESLKFGNPTEARFDSATPRSNQYKNNLLLEKPQYTVAYNHDKLNPTWVSWQLNKTWFKEPGAQSPSSQDWLADPQLPGGWTGINDASYDQANDWTGYDRGHGVPAGDRSRSDKDNMSTYLGTNSIPQSIDNNRYFGRNPENPSTNSAWFNIEARGRSFAGQRREIADPPTLNREVFITAGSFGTDGIVHNPRSIAQPTGNNKPTNPQYLLNTVGLNIPAWTWKTMLVLDEPGMDIADVKTNNAQVYTWITPNLPEPSSDWTGQSYVNPLTQLGVQRTATIQSAAQWRNPETWAVSLSELENILNSQGQGFRFNFLSNLPEDIRNPLKARQPSAFLMAAKEETLNWIADNAIFGNQLSSQAPIGVGRIPKPSIIQSDSSPLSRRQISSEQIRPRQVSPGQLSFPQIGVNQFDKLQQSATEVSLAQISTTKIGISSLRPLQISSTQVGVDDLGTRQPDIVQIDPRKIGTVHNDPSEVPFSTGVASNQIGGFNDPTWMILDDSIRHRRAAEQGVFIHDEVTLSSQEIDTNQVGIHQTGSRQVGIAEVSPNQVDTIQFSTSQPSVTEVGANQYGISKQATRQIGSTEIGTNQVGMHQGSLSQIGFPEDNVAQISVFDPNATQVHTSKVPFSVGVTSQQLVSVHNDHLMLNAAYNSATTLWNVSQNAQAPFQINIFVQDLPSGQLAESQINSFDSSGHPLSGTLTLDVDGNGLGWYIDPTPEDNTEYATALTSTAFKATPGSPAYGHYDLLTTILHELGHLQGIISGNSAYDTHIQNQTFTSNGITAPLTPDRSHLDSQAYPYDLMNTTLTPGVRKLPSDLDLQILKAIQSTPSPKTQGDKLLKAPLNTPPLIGINNGDFSQPAQPNWDTRGSAVILNGEAILREDNPLLSNFSQTFVIPTGAKTLQFTLTGIDLDSSPIAPGDTFEAALLNAQTQQSLLPNIGLTQTDSFLNLQHTGRTYTSNKVTITGNTNNQINLNTPHTVTVDLTGIPANTLATLSFDLLGFGTQQGSIRLDDVRLFTDAQTTPIALPDTYTIDQAQPQLLNLLANDTAASGINPTTLQVGIAPRHGTLTPSTNGTFTYTPNPSYLGTDRFTYSVQDNLGQLSNEAIVNLTILNTPPTITSLTATPNPTEGTPATFSAIATDPGNDALTYQWNFGDNSAPLTGQTVSHTYADNGTYPVILTVTDSNNGSITQTLPYLVTNLPPIVTAGADQTRYPNESLSFNGSYSDPGALDTHTVTWDFGDGTIANNTLVPTHRYSTPGTYPVTLTVTDKDGGTSTATLTVTILPQPTLSISSQIHPEGDSGTSLLTLTVNLSESSTQPITVHYQTADDTAIAGQDYTATTGTLTFAPGETTKAIAIPMLGDTLDEPDETLLVTLDTPTHATLATSQAIVTITDNDNPPVIEISDRTITETDNGSTQVLFTVNLSTASSKPITMSYVTANGTANAGEDYTATIGTLTFAPGETSKAIALTITGDRLDEPDETIFVLLSNPTNATLTNMQAIATILDNDNPPTVTISDRTLTETDSGTTEAIFTVTLSEASGLPITLNYSSADGTAIAGQDYTATTGTLTFAPGQTTQTIAVPVLGDLLDEANETFFLNLTQATNAAIADAQGLGTITDNDNPPTLTIDSPSLIEGNANTQQLTFTVTLSAPSGQPVTVNYTTANGSATAGSDYVAASGTLTFAPGETRKTIALTLFGDTTYEPDETLSLNLNTATNATIAGAIGTGTILNDDPAITTDTFEIITEGIFRSNGVLDLDGIPTNLNDDIHVYAAKGFTINGTATLPVQYNPNGQPRTDAQGRKILVDNAIVVSNNYTQSSINGNNNYAGLNPPPILNGISVTVPTFAELKTQETARRIPTGTAEVVLNVTQTPLTAANWSQRFPTGGTATQPRVVRIIGGTLTIPAGVTIANTIILVDNGNIVLTGNAQTLNNVMLIANTGSINLANAQAKDTTVLAATSLTMNGSTRFDGTTLLANGSGDLTFNGATKLNDSTQNLTVVSQGNLTFNGAQNSRGTFIARQEFTFNGNSQLYGRIRAKGDVRFNGGGTVVAPQ